MKLFAIIALFALLGVSTAEVVEGECVDFGPVEDFEAFDYLGRWYEVARYEIVTEVNADCVYFEYEGLDDGTILVTQSHFDLESDQPNTPLILEGHMEPAGAANVGQFNLFWGDAEQSSNYIVVETDYVNFSVVFDCNELLPGYANQYFWVLSRTPWLSPELIAKVNNIIDELGVVREFIRIVDQDIDTCGWEGISLP